MQPVVLPSSKEHFRLNGTFALREDVLHTVTYQEFCTEHPFHGSLALSTQASVTANAGNLNPYKEFGVRSAIWL